MFLSISGEYSRSGSTSLGCKSPMSIGVVAAELRQSLRLRGAPASRNCLRWAAVAERILRPRARLKTK